jgi:hypothetical protein
LQSVHYAVNSVLHVALTEIDDEAQFEFRQPQVREHLRFKNGVPFRGGFVVDEYESFHFHIETKRLSQGASLENWDRQLALDAETAQAKFPTRASS